MNPTAEEIRALLDYDPKTGIFRWRERTGRTSRFTGVVAGSMCRRRNREYIEIRLPPHRKLFLGHRLAWVYMTGQWPENHVDHIDLIGTNNAWDNLREATNSENLFNRGKTSRNTSGYKGVWLHRRLGKWCAEIKASGHRHRLGTFETPELAAAAYAEAAKRLHGEFANVA